MITKRDFNKISLASFGLIKFNDFFGEPIPRSNLYKSLKSLIQKKLIKHLGSKRSSLYSV